MTNPHNHVKYADACANYDIPTFLAERATRNADGCLVWDLARNHGGYGVYTFTKRGYSLQVHRAMYWATTGPIVGDLVVDHMCQNRSCVEPAHLRAITRELNTSLAHSARKSHCVHGHELNSETVYVFHDRKGNPHRQCRTCRKRIDRDARDRKRRRV